MRRDYRIVMPRTAEYMRERGFDERSIREITGLSLREITRYRLWRAVERELRREGGNGNGGSGRGGGVPFML